MSANDAIRCVRWGGSLAALSVALLVSAPPLHAQVHEFDCWVVRRMASVRADCGRSDLFGLSWTENRPDSIRRQVDLSPVLGTVRLRSAYPTFGTDGAEWIGRGISTGLRFGINGSRSGFRWAVEPALVFSTNLGFELADGDFQEAAAYAYPWARRTIDLPQRMGGGPFLSLSPGRSFVEYARPLFVAGLTTEAAWVGWARRYPLMGGAGAQGPPTLYLSGRLPWSGIGDVQGSFEWSRLRSSEYFQPTGERLTELLSSLTVSWVAPGRSFGVAARVSHRSAWPEDGLSFGQLVDFIQVSSLQDEAEQLADGFLGISAFLELSDRTRFVMDLVRGDYSGSGEDLFTQPEHTLYWMAGLHHRFEHATEGEIDLIAEYARTRASDSQNGPRGFFSGSLYRHQGSPKGYTHLGQPLGASLGPGAQALHLSARSAKRAVWFEWTVHDEDTFIRRLRDTPGGRRDTEYAIGVETTWAHRGVDVEWGVGLARRSNRGYRSLNVGGSDGGTEWNLLFDARLSWERW